MPFYRLYIDESGNSDLNASDNPNHRYLSLTGVCFELDYVKNILHPDLENLKDTYFDSHPDEPVILHRKEIMNKVGRFKVLNDPEIRRQFDNSILAVLKNSGYTVFSVLIDKKKQKEQYTTWRYDPYHYCLEVLIERYAFFLKEVNERGDLLAESRGGPEDRRLKDSYRRLYENGSHYIDPLFIQRHFSSKELKVKPKSDNISGLQIADLLAHSARDSILIDNGLLNFEKLTDFSKSVIKILEEKFYRHNGQIANYSKKFLP